jgi:hypothetical protein
MLLVCWGYFTNEQRPHTPLKVVARPPCCLAMLVGLMLLSGRHDLHSQRTGRHRAQMVKKSRCIIPGVGFEQPLHSLLWYK